ncbi:hypothetical protein JCM8202_001955 [Rhodotorula sphaerocarpa]
MLSPPTSLAAALPATSGDSAVALPLAPPSATPSPAAAPAANVANHEQPPHATRTASRTEQHRPPNWREEHATDAERADSRNKLGIQNHSVAFNTTTSPRQSRGASDGPSPRRRSPSPFETLAGTSPRSPGLPSSPRGPQANRTFGPEGNGVPGAVAMNRALLSNEGEALETLLGPEPASSGGVEADHRGNLHGRESENGTAATSESASTGLGSTSLLPPPRSTSPAGSESASVPSLTPNGLSRPSTSSFASTSSPARPRSPLPSGNPSSNPFFGASRYSRDRVSQSAASAQSGSGKVISGLQSDLLQARAALESTRGQLRLSQRAVEHLGRQTEDLRETKDRLSSEIDGLSRQLARKERLQEEALTRARAAESSLSSTQQELADVKASVKGRLKELEERSKAAEEVKVRTEKEYAALRDGMRTMQEGWRDDLRWLKEELKRTKRELDAKDSKLTKILSDRTNLAASVSADVTALRTTTATLSKRHDQASSSAFRQLGLLAERTEGDRERVGELQGELKRLRRSMVEFQVDEAAAAGAGRGAADGLSATGVA